ncbi:hypothetical protein AUJ77_00285 [Candidatus Nomurabacteria bacterium CG1_02_43_90]|uniref:Uncharacterized protein n=1 Tax=Candidatus Nomurabacteria bacterium CG1_02_43_90 TaxID=1805281 RepID=A0A1J4V240_9BACT|nr:MAG: hypothetical protein AUJ77_00285 [Candidatus Nomurabacteria bacterium CG1_02_43_90]
MIFFTKLKKILDKSFLKELSWYTIGQTTVQIFFALGVIITSRYLGPDNLGLYSFVQNYLSVFMLVAVGMDFYFTWRIAKSEDKIKDLKEYFGHKIYITSSFSILGIILAWSILPSDVALMSTILCAPLFLSSFTAFFQYAIVINKARIIALTQILSSLTLFLMKVFLVNFHAPLLAFVAVSAGDTFFMVTLLALFFLSNPEIRKPFFYASFPSIFSTIKFLYAIRFMVISLALWQLLLRVDQLVLATFSNAYTLGIYSAAVKITEVPNFFAGGIYASLVAHIASTALRKDDHSKNSIRKVMLLYFSSGTVISILTIITAPFIVSLLYGPKFIEVTPILRVYALSIPGMFLVYHYLAIYAVQGKHLQQAFIFSLGIIINIVLIYILTPIFGITGTAFATVISYTFMSGVFYLHMR